MNPIIATVFGAIFGALIASGGDDSDTQRTAPDDTEFLYEGYDQQEKDEG